MTPTSSTQPSEGLALRLPGAWLPKAQRYMRALRRSVLSYWYSTLEDLEAAYLEAAAATFLVNIMDEAVFEAALGDPYRTHRARDRLGKVVMGLELVRNCETHAPVIFDGLLVERQRVGVPVSSGQLMRVALSWAYYEDLPEGYRDLPSDGGTDRQVRARGEAQHGFRQAVQGRSVVETLLDALAHFQRLDDRLAVEQAPETRWAFAELPDTDPTVAKPTSWVIARPLGLDRWEVELPDLACQWWERRNPGWEASDGYLSNRVREAKQRPPESPARQVLHRIIDSDGALVGYSGLGSDGSGGARPTWAERQQQVWKDVRAGYRYFIAQECHELDVVDSGHNHVQAVDQAGVDHLGDLSVATEMPFGLERLMMAEEYPDIYLSMRRGYA